ncbi:hypothetical protein DH2020_001874 [Rehmannia glutinosa]|uniref:RDRP C-terminal head domain-containing protein n=1 Tax=Rehmannia glutinosa TaxID=99300 RepID=A0ABR0XS46_REHGL
MVDDAGKTVMLSFAWIAADYLARIKISGEGRKMISPLSRSILLKTVQLLNSCFLDLIENLLATAMHIDFHHPVRAGMPTGSFLPNPNVRIVVIEP